MKEGIGSFVFPDHAAGSRRSIRVFYFRPAAPVRNPRIVVAMHGLSRAAEVFRDVLATPADRHGMIVLVPEFDTEAFPDVYAYNYGNVRLAPPRRTVLGREHWTFGIVDRLFERVRRELDIERATFGMFGNSAGAQFVLRYLALTDALQVDQAVASNSGIYMPPDLNAEYPDGMGGLGLDDGSLRRYFGRRLTILLGEADSDSTATQLRRDAAAMAQGPHRLARGLWYFNHCRTIADRLGARLDWRLEVVPGAGHADQALYNHAIGVLAEE